VGLTRALRGISTAMSKLREHPVLVTLFAYAVAAAAVVAIAGAYGFHAFGQAWTHTRPGWLALAGAAEVLAIPAYSIAYRGLGRVHGDRPLPLPIVMRLVIAGFGPFAAGGGFSLDKRALATLRRDPDGVIVRVLALGALEWGLLAPAAWVSALVLLARADHRAMPSLLWPWAIAVPVGFAIGLWLTAPDRRDRIVARDTRWVRRVAPALHGVGVLHELVRSPVRHATAWLGTTLYWALDIAALYCAARFVGVPIGVAEAVLAYATGYALTRRSLPLGGAGVTETLMTFALHWVGWPVPEALAAVAVYRFFNFVVPTLPALIVRPQVKPLLDAADEGRVPSEQERRRAARRSNPLPERASGA
jgi:uncharacterized membrane protein YbhN (UPF0104 family)